MEGKKLEHKLVARNIQPTAMRLLVLRYLIEMNRALSLTDLEHHFVHSDRTTLYRTLKTFQDHGLVHQVNDVSGITKYALCSDDCSCSFPGDLHVHFHCSECNKTYCLPDQSLPEIMLPQQFNPDSANFVINGTCSLCTI